MITLPRKSDTPEKVERLAVSASEAAKMLSLSPRTLHQLTKDGEIRAKRVGRKLLYGIDELRRFLGEN